MITYTQFVVDTFQRANENPLSQGGNWTKASTSGFGPLQIVADLCEATQNGAAPDSDIYTGVNFPNDQYAEITLATLTQGALGSVLLVGVRGNIPITTGYTASIGNPGSLGGSCTIVLTSQSNSTQIGSFSGTVNVGDVLRIECLGTSISVKLNGAVIIGPITDTHSSSGQPFILAFPSTVNSQTQISKFAAGSITMASSVIDSRNSTCGLVPATHTYPNNSRVVQGTVVYDVETSNNAAIPPVDSRTAGAPVDSRVNRPQNSRT